MTLEMNRKADENDLTEKERTALVDEILTRGIYEKIEDSPGELKQSLLHEKLRVKLGIDPTSPSIHFGRSVSLLKLRDFQKLGHKVVLIIGDFTGEVGDTSDKEAGRPMLSEEQVKKNMRTYAEQAGKILDMDNVELHYNSEWLADMSFGRISRLADLFGVGEFISRDLIKRRLAKGQRVSVRELLYPLMMGYDSVAVKADLELGGADQKFNLLAGRTIQASFGMKRQSVLMTNLISGTDGQKMSSSVGNTVNLNDSPEDMFGRIMSARDEVIVSYFIHCTRVPMDQVLEIEKKLKEGANPRDIKMLLARSMTLQIYGEEKTSLAEEYFKTVFQQKEIPSDIKEVEIKGSRKIIDVLVTCGLAPSRSEAKRLLIQRGIKVNNEIVNENYEVPHNALLQKGKRNFFKVK